MSECTCGACVVPLVEITGPLTGEAAQKWAASEGVELRSTWDRRVAVSVDDAAAVFERASAAAEVARQRNEAKLAAQLAAQSPVLPGVPVPEGLRDLRAIDVMRAGERDERLEKLDELYQEYASGHTFYHPVRDEG